jgi:hypothetical protein
MNEDKNKFIIFCKKKLQILTIQRATQANLSSLTFEDSEIKINPGEKFWNHDRLKRILKNFGKNI